MGNRGDRGRNPKPPSCLPYAPLQAERRAGQTVGRKHRRPHIFPSGTGTPRNIIDSRTCIWCDKKQDAYEIAGGGRFAWCWA